MGAFTTRMAGALAALALAGCGATGGSGAGATACPRIAILADGADLTRYRPGAPPDLTQMVVDARIAGFEARCDVTNRGGALEVRITPRFEAERGPAAQGRTAELGWFAAVTDTADNVLDRVSGRTQVTFPANTTRAAAAGPAVQLDLPLAGGQRAADYLVRLSFQLTPEELAQNRRRGPR
ncbi:hypothetical protein [Falsiroseomonas oryziterrae]|uniref:hypothetical protein n=1 Tax=Falsiroseomonas oryziterrae TaxID=2911368 RepID=UPI001F22C499|nr:hypothetical protein [Roseomonas sp. NPKOSM-4]